MASMATPRLSMTFPTRASHAPTAATNRSSSTSSSTSFSTSSSSSRFHQRRADLRCTMTRKVSTRLGATTTTTTETTKTTTMTTKWEEAWRSVAEPTVRVAYIDDDARASLRGALEASRLAEALEGIDGEVFLKATLSTSNPDARALGLEEALLGRAAESKPLDPALAAEAAAGVALLETDVCDIVRSFGLVTGRGGTRFMFTRSVCRGPYKRVNSPQKVKRDEK